jgi:hypothetical protein
MIFPTTHQSSKSVPIVSELERKTTTGIPAELSPEEPGSSILNARDNINDEAARSGGTRDPAEVSHSAISDSDVAALRSKFPFLKDFSDNFIRSNKPDSLMKLETANMKLKEAERTKDADDKLAHNRSNIGTICIDMGLDDRTSILHDSRFLPGANCSAAKLWLAARNRTPLHGAPPLGNSDMAAVGLGGFVSPRGWVELANPASTRLSLRQFNIRAREKRQAQRKTTTTPTFRTSRKSENFNWRCAPSEQRRPSLCHGTSHSRP